MKQLMALVASIAIHAMEQHTTIVSGPEIAPYTSSLRLPCLSNNALIEYAPESAGPVVLYTSREDSSSTLCIDRGEWWLPFRGLPVIIAGNRIVTMNCAQRFVSTSSVLLDGDEMPVVDISHGKMANSIALNSSLDIIVEKAVMMPTCIDFLAIGRVRGSSGITARWIKTLTDRATITPVVLPACNDINDISCSFLKTHVPHHGYDLVVTKGWYNYLYNYHRNR